MNIPMRDNDARVGSVNSDSLRKREDFTSVRRVFKHTDGVLHHYHTVVLAWKLWCYLSGLCVANCSDIVKERYFFS